MGICLTSMAPQNDQDELIWSPWQRLSWKNFTKRTGPEELYKAFTYSGIRYTIEGKDGLAQVNCIPYFLASESWVHTEHMTPELLVHEQGHFDITAVYAMRMQSVMSEIEVPIAEFKEKNYQDRAQVIFDSVYTAMESRQRMYDEDTHHGIDKPKQMEWNRALGFEIDSLMMITSYVNR